MSFLTVNEFAAFVSGCKNLVAAKAEFDAKKSQVVESWRALIEAGFKRINVPAWDKDALEARGFKIPPNRRDKISAAYTELMIEYVNNSDSARALIAAKLDLGAVGTVTPKLWAQYVKACGKSLGGEIQTVRNHLSKLLVSMGFAQVYVAPKEVTAQTIADGFESKALDLELVQEACDIYARKLGVVPPVREEVNSIESLVKMFTASGLDIESVQQALEVYSAGLGTPVKTPTKSDMILEVAAMDPAEIASVLGLEGGMELAVRLADTLQPVA